MISWGTIVYGAVLSAVAAVVLVFASRRDRRFDVLAAVAISGFLGPFLWNAILHRIEAREFFVDAPLAVMPASWQDTGSGVFAVAVTVMLLGLGPLGSAPARRAVAYALLAGLAAFLVDVYLY